MTDRRSAHTSASGRTSATPRRPWPSGPAPSRRCPASGSAASRACTRPSRSASPTSPSSATRSSRSTSRPGRPGDRRARPPGRAQGAGASVRPADAAALGAARARPRPARVRPRATRDRAAAGRRGRSTPSSTRRKAARLLEVPHPRGAQRLFVLAPLADLAPGLVPPGWGETVETARRRRPPSRAPDAVRPIGAWDAARPVAGGPTGPSAEVARRELGLERAARPGPRSTRYARAAGRDATTSTSCLAAEDERGPVVGGIPGAAARPRRRAAGRAAGAPARRRSAGSGCPARSPRPSWIGARSGPNESVVPPSNQHSDPADSAGHDDPGLVRARAGSGRRRGGARRRACSWCCRRRRR